MFTEIALPRYFGHKNYASFVRIVNAWGFRRVTNGLDRDSYYHEVSKLVFSACKYYLYQISSNQILHPPSIHSLFICQLFLRGKPELHQRMKRLPTTHRKTPISKEDKAPDFYELSKTSPLPEVTLSKPAPTMFNGSMHPMGSGYFASPAIVGGTAAAAAASVDTAAAQGDNADSKDKQDDATAKMLEQNMRLSNELLRRQLLELQQRESIAGYPRNAAEAEARMNHQLMQLQRERFQQVQQGQAETDQQKKEDASKTANDEQQEQPVAAKDDDTKEKDVKKPDTNEEEKKEGAKVSPMVKDLIDNYNKDKKV